jgi:hypothetical protein
MDIELLVTRLAQAILRELEVEKCETVLLFATMAQKLPEGLSALIDRKARVLHVDESYQPEQVDRFILPCLHIDQMVDLAIGRGGSKLIYGVRQVLLSGRKVEVYEWEYLRYQETVPRPMLDLYTGYRKQLETFGLTDCTSSKKTSVRFDGNVLTEADILQARQQGAMQFDIAARCRVTPLAIETARNIGIRIITATGGIA